ncbi:CRE-COQ-6 protein [Caenorhabditis remanei]|uniref:Ubiquinone biosynthesis monooxygenase COQ6, mitochondrial n=1 Tax=Caenorhabditis remanei TaxID=31234 RepID=E3MDA1_CAERE|nr:CRE-COQ-6 protein [Caenorhabditis remanei]
MYRFQLKIAGDSVRVISSRNASSYYDAVIVGGGMVGNAMACSLGLNASFASKSVLLLDSGKPPSLSSFESGAPYKNRVVAITPTSQDVFKKLDIWDRMNAHRVRKVNRLYVFDSCSTSEIEFEREKQEEVAFIIENELIVAALYDKLPDCRNVEVRTEAKVEEVSIPNALEQMAYVKLANGDVIETSLLIGADGANSKVRRAANVGYTTFDYNQHGLVGTVDIEPFLVFAKLGPVALLPLSDSVSALTWSTSPEEAKRLKNLPADQFVDELNNALFSQEEQQPLVNQALFAFNRLNPFRWETFGRKPDGTTPPHVISVRDNRGTFPLGFGSAHRYIAPRCALIGDAAHKMHPLAGQGVNLGWSDVQILDQILGDAVREGADIGSLTYLKEFDSAAQKHNLPVMVSVDLLNRLYRTDAPAIVAARAFGLNAFNSLGPVKNFLINYLSAHR